MFDPPTYMLPADSEQYVGSVATSGLGASLFCFAALTTTKRPAEPSPEAAPVAIVVLSPSSGNNLLTSVRLLVGTALIAIGQRLAPVQSSGASGQ